MTKQNLTINASANEQLKHRFKELRDLLTAADQVSLPQFAEFVRAAEPEYDCPEGYDRIRNTWYLRVADYKLTEMLIQYQNHLNL